MTREEIEKISVVEPYRFESYFEKIWYDVGCIDGLKAADAEPNLNSIWHDASYIPQCEYDIICQDEFRHVWLTDYREDINHYKNGWKECAECECIVRWAYIDDLLPK